MRLLLSSAAIACLSLPLLADPLPSWNATDTKARIISFVDAVTDPDSPDYVRPADRIATFDNDGTLWGEQPVYFQVIYAVDQVARMAEADLSILDSDAMKAAAAGDMAALVATGKEGLVEVVTAAHSGMSVSEFKADVAAWLDTARHPDTGRPYDEMLYQPMLELLRYLRDEGFSTYIVSGGGIDFIRVFSEAAYNIPPNQVVGSSLAGEYKTDGDGPRIMKMPSLFFIDDKEGKPVAINHHIGKRPILAGGNSDGDFQMLEWTTSGDGARLALIVHHTDAEREYAYDRDSHIGGLERGLDEAEARGWLLIDMAADWARVWPE
ncbi:haloacid dehalogenase-like hydrolase [Cribrihabitans marinus]|uniref:Haloacid dehalogenase-like hydrolase n=1 Tax=Cribrihabitans marinus TaxID=1227549 RepID=A0A1H6VX43_9RHOB|nr:HAD family hydrolase [Cribrihabitans marinus]GGH25020.1 haloacid dehalogenase [Cribrihabitans marinus]SEJ09209.1 haloacid dehalogenase-like hydrolase [Cribrihabitans marinus]